MENNLIQQPNSTASPKEAPIKLTRGMIFTLSTLLGMRYSFGRIKINRDIDAKQVKKKIASILACKGIISPFLVVPAAVCLKAGLNWRSLTEIQSQRIPQTSILSLL